MMKTTIQDLFYSVVDQYGSKNAIESGEKRLTYSELDRKSNLIANTILQRGVKKGSIIGMMVHDRIEMMILILGALKAGCIFVPFDLTYPVKRLEMMAEMLDFDLIFASEESLELVQQITESKSNSLETILTDHLFSPSEDERLKLEVRPDYKNGADDPIYIYFTSGSTGKPKGIVGRYKSLLHFIRWEMETFKITAEDRVSQLTTPGFDAFLRDLFLPICVGGTICIPQNPEIMLDAKGFAEWINGTDVSLIHCVPSLFRALNSVDLQPGDFPSLRYILMSGERLNPQDLVKWYQIFDERITLVNLYGPSETTMIKTFYIIHKLDTNERMIPIGQPLKGARVLILDDEMNICDEGAIGEIYIRTPFSTLGYYKEPELTREKFIPNPFTDDPKDLLYKTGDLGRIMLNGNIEFLGRRDHQVKIRGNRVELGEIENQLLANPAVKEAVVMAKEDEQEGAYLVAYLVMKEEQSYSQLRSELAAYLPDYMIPSYFTFLEAMPLTPNGKVDRKALPEPDQTIQPGTEYVAPGDEIEEKLAEIWSEVLHVEQIGVNDNFFELGGHSLRATSIATKIFKELQVEVPIRQVFISPTIKELAQYIQGADQSIYATIAPALKREYYPLSSAQKRLYIINELEGIATSYNMPRVAIMDGNLDVARFQYAFETIVKRHESLRTSFERRAGEPVQVVHDQVDFKVDLYEVPSEELEGLVSALVKPFDLSKAPLFRISLVKVSEVQHVFVFDMHHIVSDQVSIDILIDEFVQLYQGKELAPLRIQYKDFVVWQQELQMQEYLKQEDFWLETFSGELPSLNLPTDYPRPPVMRFRGDTYRFELGKELTGRLNELALQNGATLFMVVLAVYNTLLHKYANQEDIIVGSPIAGRPHVDLQKIVGMFVNTLAFRNYPKKELTFVEFLQQVKENALKAYENQDYQFETLLEKLNLRWDPSRSALFDTMFVMQNTEGGSFEIPDLTFTRYQYTNKITKFDLVLTSVEDRGNLICIMRFSTGIFKRETIERLAEHFIKIVEEVTAEPEKRLVEIDILPAEEKEQIVRDFNHWQEPLPKQATLHQLFEEQVAKTPKAIALVCGEEKISYAQLNEKSNQLARTLRGQGVGADTILGLMTKTSIEMVVGMLGILKAGGSYLPIDPDFPEEKIQYMMEDSQISTLVTNVNLPQGVVFAGNLLDLRDVSVYHKLDTNLEPISGESDLAYVIYTSGSTGYPKGVMIEHVSIVNQLVGLMKMYSFDESLHHILMAPFTFDPSVQQIFLPLATGGRLHLVANELKADPPELMSYIVEHQLNIINTVPSLMKLLLDYAPVESRLQFKYVILAGEEFPVNLYHKIKNSLDVEIIINIYGPTEATINTTLFECQEERIQSVIPIGKPLMNYQVYIMDEEQKLLPVGIPGELCIGGVGLARGYLNKPELEAEKFVPSPVVQGEKLYRTGDLAKWRSDGHLEFLGRVDQQVKIRGVRIELEEIEKHLLSFGAIREVAAVASEDEHGHKQICAYFSAGEQLALADVRRYLVEKLPIYMIPTYFVQLDQLPLSYNGKIDRKELSKLGISQMLELEYVAPTNEIEERLAMIWSELLGVQKIGIHDNFFGLGGHSLKATVLVGRIMREWNVEIPLREIFKTPTIKEVADLIAQGDAAFGVQDVVLLSRGNQKTSHLFLIHAGNGEIEGYLEFANNLDVNWMCWGIQAERFTGFGPKNLQMEEIASQYIEKIQEIQPHGPYHLAGWCLGGTIAFEMVRQLEESGEKVNFFGMINSKAPEKKPEDEFTLESEQIWLQEMFHDLDLTKLSSQVESVDQFWTVLAEHLEEIQYDLASLKSLIPETTATIIPNFENIALKELLYYYNVIRTFDHARSLYIPTGKIATPIHYFVATEAVMKNRDEWNLYTGHGVQSYDVDGDHFSIFALPDVLRLSKLFNNVLVAESSK